MKTEEMAVESLCDIHKARPNGMKIMEINGGDFDYYDGRKNQIRIHIWGWAGAIMKMFCKKHKVTTSIPKIKNVKVRRFFGLLCVCEKFPVNWYVIHAASMYASLHSQIKEDLALVNRDAVELDEFKYCPWCGCKTNRENTQLKDK